MEMLHADLIAENERLRARVAELERAAGVADAIIAGLPGLLVILDDQGRFVEWSRRDYQLVLGHPPGNREPGSGFPDVHPDDQDAVAAAIRDVMQGGEGATEARILTREGPRWYAMRARACVIGDRQYFVATGTDIEQTKQSEAELRAALRRLSMLARITATVVGKQSLREIAAGFAREVCETLDVDACVIRLLDGNELDLLGSSGIPDDALHRRLPVSGIAEKMLRTRMPVVIPDVAKDPTTEEHVKRGGKCMGFVSYAGVPLFVSDDPVGVLGTYTFHQKRDFTEADIEHLTTVAGTAAIALRNETLFATVQAQQQELSNWAAELERRVEARTCELQQAVSDLEAFTYSVSHDLRSPIRTMAGYATLVLEEHGPELTPDATKFVKAIRSGALRLGQLVDDLLEFSRAGRRPLSRWTVDPRPLIEACLHDARAEMSGRSVDIVIGPLPNCYADASLLRQVFHNIISNALKYTRPCRETRIEIGGQIEDGRTVYYVRDNGVGFDMAHADRLFGVFQRLHSDERFEGTGVGLALVHRIVTRHGGSVWATSEPGHGATFYVALPLQEEDVEDAVQS